MEKFKRKVFYLGGFDPRGVRFYHQMYREQAATYTRLSGEHVEVSARRSGPASSAIWTVTNNSAGVETDYEFLRWEDLVGKVAGYHHPLPAAARGADSTGAGADPCAAAFAADALLGCGLDRRRRQHGLVGPTPQQADRALAAALHVL
jgi:hypothetical protein